MTILRILVVLLAVGVASLTAQEPNARQVAQEREQAELDAPKLVEVLELKPGMTVADIGAGGGAMTVVLGKWIGSGHVYATDITQRALQTTREYAKREGLTNVTVIEGADAATNLPVGCCDAVFLRHVYHHIIEISAFSKSLHASLRAGGRLAIIDFEGRPDPARIPKGVPANRLGHGIPASVVIEELTAAGFTHVLTIANWPPGDKNPTGHLTLFRK
ncbi:MAG TPA: methyltransferase domain-containing protein [Vicinamibacterales bacterium]